MAVIKYWSVIKTEISKERSVAQTLLAKGHEICQLVETRFIRYSRHTKRRRTVEVNILPGKIIALIPDIALEDMGDIPHTLGIARDAQGSPWRIPGPQISEFQESLSALNSGEFARLIAEAERDNQSRRKTGRRWLKLGDWKPQT